MGAFSSEAGTKRLDDRRLARGPGEAARGQGQVGAGFQILGFEIVGKLLVFVHEVFTGNAALEFLFERIAVGKHHHLNTLLGGNDLNDRHVFEHVGFFVKLAENQFAGDEFEQPDRFGHCDLLKVVYRPK